MEPQIESMNGANPAPQGADPLLELPDDDPIFKATEPHRGLPPAKDIIRAMPEDGRRLLQNSMLGAKTAAEKANAAIREAEAERAAAATARAEAEAARLAWEQKLSGISPTTVAALPGAEDAFIRRAWGIDQDDPYADRPLPEVAFSADEEMAALKEDGVLSDAALAAVSRLISKAATAGAHAAVRAARDDLTYTGRATAKPMIDALEAQAQAARAAEAQTAEQQWRAAHPGTDTAEGWADFYNHTREVHGLKDTEGWPMQKPSDWEVNYKAWRAERGATVAAPATPAPVATAPAPTPAPASSPQNAVQDLIRGMRVQAQAAQGGGGIGTEGSDLVMPDHVKADPVAKARWINQNPSAKRAFDENDQDAIARIMGSARARALRRA